MKPTPEQIAAAKDELRNQCEPKDHHLVGDLIHFVRDQNKASNILLAALEAAEADGARLDWLNRQSDIVYYDGTHGTVWNIGVEGEDRTLCVRTAIDQAMKKDAARKEDRT